MGTEVIRYTQIGKEDIRFGLSTFEVVLADGRKVVLSELDLGAILNNPLLSSQILTGFTLIGAKFPATQVPSSDLNTLDDYEEFTWTPTPGGTSVCFSQIGTGVKIGKNVWAKFSVIITTIGTGSKTTLSGLPFAAADNSFGGSIYNFSGLALSVVMLAPSMAGSSISINSMTAAGTGMAANLLLTDDTVISGSVWYQASN